MINTLFNNDAHPFEGPVRTRTGVVVTTTHPILGPLYWYFMSEASVNGPDYYSITDSIDSALLLDSGWRETTLFRYYGDHIEKVLRDTGQISRIGGIDEYGECFEIDLEGRIAYLQRKSGQSAVEFLDWLGAAQWSDVTGPACTEQLVDHGYSSEWIAITNMNTPRDSLF